jgi:hypothetical protein
MAKALTERRSERSRCFTRILRLPVEWRSWLQRLAWANLVLSGLVVLVPVQPMETSRRSRGYGCEEIPAARSCEESRPSQIIKCITIPSRAPDVYGVSASNHLVSFLVGQLTRISKINVNICCRENGGFIGYYSRGLMGRFSQAAGKHPNIERSVNSKCWGLAMISQNALDYDICRWRNSEKENKAGSYRDICTQLSSRMPLSTEPQRESCSEQRNGEQRHYRRADRNYFGVVFSDRFNDAFDAALLVFFFTGPLVGFAFLFLNRWLGGSILLGWLCLILYTLSGLWL